MPSKDGKCDDQGNDPTLSHGNERIPELSLRPSDLGIFTPALLGNAILALTWHHQDDYSRNVAALQGCNVHILVTTAPALEGGLSALMSWRPFVAARRRKSGDRIADVDIVDQIDCIPLKSSVYVLN